MLKKENTLTLVTLQESLANDAVKFPKKYSFWFCKPLRLQDDEV